MSSKKTCDIFISYRRDGGDMTAMYIYQALKERKYDVFYDLEVLRAGRFNDSLLEYIGSCKDFILVLSPGSLDRCNDEGDWVRKEIAEALRLKKNIIPVMLKGFRFPDVLPDDIDDVRYQNGLTATTEYFQESMNRLCTKYMQTKPKKIPVFAGVSAGVALLLALILGIRFLPSNQPKQESVALVTEKVTENATEKETEKATEEMTEAIKTTPVNNTDWPVMRYDGVEDLYDGMYANREEEMPVLQNEEVLRKEVSTVTFLNTLAQAGEDAWDISEAQDGSVLAWTEPDEELYHLYIAGEGGVRAPEECPGLFLGYQNVKTIDFNGYFDTSENTNFDQFFKNCINLKTLDLRTLDTSSGQRMVAMFHCCCSLTDLDLSTFDISSANEIQHMFSCLNSIKMLDVSNLDTSRVTDMTEMFSENWKMKKVLFGSGFNTSRVKSMEGMFAADESLQELDLSGFQTGKVENMERMFERCVNILELDVSGFDTSKVQNMNNMFAACEMIDHLDVSGWNIEALKNTANMFYSCTSLSDIGTTEGKLYEQLKKAKNQKYSRANLFSNYDNREHTVEVIWRNGEEPVICPFTYNEETGHSYLFVNCPLTGSAAALWVMDDGRIVTINSKEELEYLEQWSQNDSIDFNNTWIGGVGDGSVYSMTDDVDYNQLWEEFWSFEALEGSKENDPYFAWAENQPDGNGHFLQLLAKEEDGQIVLTMDDVNDDILRPCILEYDRQLTDGEIIDLSWQVNGGDEKEGYGVRCDFEDGSCGRLDENGVLVVSGSGSTNMYHMVTENLYIREIIIKEGMKEIGDHTFSWDKNLTKVTLPESLTRIGVDAFGETGLTSITIPSGVTEIGEAAFDNIVRNLTICGESGSYAETYAKENGIKFNAIITEKK